MFPHQMLLLLTCWFPTLVFLSKIPPNLRLVKDMKGSGIPFNIAKYSDKNDLPQEYIDT